MTQVPIPSTAGRIVFGPFCLTLGERLLTREGVPVEIGGRTLDLLAALLEQPGSVLSKRDLLKRVWPDVVVEDGSLRFHMAGLRKILGDGENGARYIATQVGVGYAFVARVQRLTDPVEAPIAEAASGLVKMLSDDALAGRLPARLTRLFGRDEDSQLLVDRIPKARLFTIVGPAGAGKTTLAVEIGHGLKTSFGGKVSFVDLGALEDPALLASAIAGALGMRVQSEDPMAVVLGHIRQEHLLLILDNCEHLIEAASHVVERIIDAAPKVSILATSREPLRVRGEHVHWLGSLAYPDSPADLSREALLAYPAVALFVERAAAGNSMFTLDLDAVRQIADLCSRLDGMALSIELTAVRVAAHGLEGTARLLGERFALSWAGRRTALPRQQTLQATLDWSYDLLSDIERLTLERLSVFLGPFSIEAAIEVVADDKISAGMAAAALDELTAKSLVSPDRAGGADLYRLLELTRAYAKEKLLARGPAMVQTISRRHAAFFLQELETAGAPQQRCLDRVEYFCRQLANIRSALDWSFGPGGDMSIGVPLASASVPVFMNLSHLVECRDWCARAVAQLGTVYQGSAIEMEVQAALGLSLMFTRGNSEAAEAALRRALDVAIALDDHWNQLRLLGRLQIFHERIGDYGTARSWADQAVHVAEKIDLPEATAVAASLAGISHHLEGDQSRAREELELSLRLHISSDRRRTVYYGFDHRNRTGIALARVLWLMGAADQAKAVAERTAREAAGLKHPVTHCIALIWMFSVDFWSGDLEKGETTIASFLHLAEINAMGPYLAAAVGMKGQLAVRLGQDEEAIDRLEESLARLRAARYELLTTSFSVSLAQGLCHCGRNAEALEVVRSSIDRCTASGELLGMPELLRIKANVLYAMAGRATGEVEDLLLDSIGWSRRQGARGWELRAATDLARLWMEGGDAHRGYGLLKPLYDLFQEGADTADLRAADLLLRLLTDLGGESVTTARAG